VGLAVAARNRTEEGRPIVRLVKVLDERRIADIHEGVQLEEVFLVDHINALLVGHAALVDHVDEAPLSRRKLRDSIKVIQKCLIPVVTDFDVEFQDPKLGHQEELAASRMSVDNLFNDLIFLAIQLYICLYNLLLTVGIEVYDFTGLISPAYEVRCLQPCKARHHLWQLLSVRLLQSVSTDVPTTLVEVPLPLHNCVPVPTTTTLIREVGGRCAR
jgi:hypothetical protein